VTRRATPVQLEHLHPTKFPLDQRRKPATKTIQFHKRANQSARAATKTQSSQQKKTQTKNKTKATTTAIANSTRQQLMKLEDKRTFSDGLGEKKGPPSDEVIEVGC
jgi:ribosomal protein L14E/L6E/L27E